MQVLPPPDTRYHFACASCRVQLVPEQSDLDDGEIIGSCVVLICPCCGHGSRAHIPYLQEKLAQTA